MAWIAEDRRHQRLAAGQPLLTDDLKTHLRDVYFPRYPTKRACLLPALHLIQHEYGHIDPAALQEIGTFLEVAPAEVLDTATFYEEYWLKPKGKYLVAICRSLACEITGADGIIDGLLDKLGLEELGETTDDGRFTLVALECLGSCGTAPVALVNDVLHETVDLPGVSDLIDGLPDDPHDYADPSVDFDVPHGNPDGAGTIDLQGRSTAPAGGG
jgi:NADH-quinone oxidoreductase subunit E